MQFGLRLPSFALGDQTASLAEMGAYLRRAEDLGFGTAMLIDHLLVAPPAYRTTWLEPITLLAALSGVTRTIQLGTLVLVLPLREPVQFAKQWATLDQLSGGRSILGVGVGWMEAEFEAVGIPHRERGARMNELLELITALWTEDHVTYEGRFYRVHDLTLDPKPAQRPHPPIWIGGGTQPSEKIYGQRVADGGAGAAPDREVREDLGPPLLRDGRDGRPRLGRPPGVHARVRAASRTRCRACTRTSSTCSSRASAPRTRRRCSGCTRAWTSTTGSATTCSARPRRSPTGSARKIEALGGVDHLVLNPLNWDPENLERLAGDVLPRVVA